MQGIQRGLLAEQSPGPFRSESLTQAVTAAWPPLDPPSGGPPQPFCSPSSR